MVSLMLAAGGIIVCLVIYALIKGYDARVTLIGAGILMACIGGAPMSPLNAFAKSMTNSGLIQAVCSVMGFAMVVRFTGCDKHLINAMASVISRVRFSSFRVSSSVRIWSISHCRVPQVQRLPPVRSSSRS